MKKLISFRTLAACAALAAAAAILASRFPIKESFAKFLEWAQGVGPWGPVVLAAAYIPACVLFFPGSILTLGAGFAFGVAQGVIAVSIGSVLGVSAAFFTGRFLARRWIERKVSASPKFRAIDQAVSEAGFKIVLLARLSPVFPFNVLNYAFGLTRVRFRDYFFASWIGMLPGTALYVYLGATVKNLADLVSGKIDGGVPQKILFGAGLAATLVVTILVTRIAKRALKKSITEKSITDNSITENPTPNGTANPMPEALKLQGAAK